MKKFAKIIENKIVWFIRPAGLLGDCTEYAVQNGFKEVEEISGIEEKFEELEDKIVVTYPVPVKKPELLILQSNAFLANKSEDEIKSFDIDLLEGLHKETKYSKGYLYKKSYYTDKNKTILAIERTFELVFKNNYLTGEKSVIKWFDTQKNVFCVKETYTDFSAKDSAVKFRTIRQTQIDYLQYPEVQYQIPQVMSAIKKLFEHYKEVVLDYITAGTNSFKEAVETETNSEIKKILSSKLPDGKTFKESIIYQIT